MNLIHIKYVKKKEKTIDDKIKLENNEGFNVEDGDLENMLFKEIPKTTINFKKNKKRKYTDYDMGIDYNDYYSDDEEDEDSDEDNENKEKIIENNEKLKKKLKE